MDQIQWATRQLSCHEEPQPSSRSSCSSSGKCNDPRSNYRSFFGRGADSAAVWHRWTFRYRRFRGRLVSRFKLSSTAGCERLPESRHKNQRQRILCPCRCNTGAAGLFRLGHQRRSVAAATDWSEYADAFSDRSIALPPLSIVGH